MGTLMRPFAPCALPAVLASATRAESQSEVHLLWSQTPQHKPPRARAQLSREHVRGVPKHQTALHKPPRARARAQLSRERALSHARRVPALAACSFFHVREDTVAD